MAVATAIAAVGVGVAGVGAYKANQNAKKAAAAQREAAELDRKRMTLQNARERRDAIRASRLAFAQAQQNAENQGASASSASQGGLGSIQSQLSSNISFLDRFSTLSDMASQQLGRAQIYQQRASTAQAVSNLGMAVFNSSDKLAEMWTNPGG